MFTVNLVAQTTPVKIEDLPQTIIDNVSKNHTGYTIKEAQKIQTHESLNYRVKVTKQNSEMTLLYDKEGRFIRKVMVKSGTLVKKSIVKKKT